MKATSNQKRQNECTTTRRHNSTKERWGDLSERATKRLREHPIQMHPLELSALSLRLSQPQTTTARVHERTTARKNDSARGRWDDEARQ